jgi:hypothetical protein
MPDPSYQSKVYRSQGSSALVVASGGSLQLEPGAQVTGLGAAGVLPGNIASGTIDLGPHLFAGREAASGETVSSGSTAPAYFFGGFILPDTSPAFTLTSSGDQSFYLNWTSANTDGLKLPPIAMPADLSTAGGMSIDLYGESVGTATAADAKSCFDVRCWAGIGDTEMGATHPDFSSAPSWQSITIASGDLTTTVLNVTLVPQAHAGRAIRLYSMRARYTRTS